MSKNNLIYLTKINAPAVISDNYDECSKQSKANVIEATDANKMKDLIDFFYFETVHQIQSLWVYSSNLKKAFNWFSSYFLVIEAAGGLVQNKNNDYLLIYRFNHWDLPKGKLEKGETIEQAALREVEEECALSNLVLNEHITNTYHTYQQKDVMCLKKTYWYKMYYNDDMQPSPQVEEGIEKAVWVKSKNLHKHLPTMYMSVIEVFKKLGIKID